MMDIYSSFLRVLVEWQYTLNSYISTTIRSLNNENSVSVSLSIILVAFVYGAIHAAGPGHGKALVAFYFTSNKSDYKKAFQMGYMIAIIHALSALFLTFGIFFILKTMIRQNFNNFSNIAMQISAVMIMCVGLYLIYEAYTSRKYKDKIIKKVNKSMIAVAFSAGIVPCPGVMTIVLFCVVLKQLTLGVLAAIAMSIGMGLTISLAGILSIAINKKTSGKLSEKRYILEIIGALLVFILGVFLLLASFH